ncbi:MAG: RimK/LysX family protein [Pseudomonadota bacterium]
MSVLGALALSLAGGALANEDGFQRGWLEHAQIGPSGLNVDAKLDSGAKTSSIHAEILRGPGGEDEELEEDEEAADGSEADAPPPAPKADTVVFRLSNEDGENMILEREIVRYVRVKRRDGSLDERPVVILELCLAGLPISGEVNLTDRSRFNYPLLVGRTMLADADVIIDPRKIYTDETPCPEAETTPADGDEETRSQ